MIPKYGIILIKISINLVELPWTMLSWAFGMYAAYKLFVYDS
jgi:hypothetical protein